MALKPGDIIVTVDGEYKLPELVVDALEIPEQIGAAIDSLEIPATSSDVGAEPAGLSDETRAALAAVKPAYVVTVGDSMAAFNSTYMTSFSRLGPVLAGEHVETWRVYATGGDDLIESNAGNLTSALALNPLPSHILVALGTNDIGTLPYDPAAHRATFDAYLDRITDAGITPILWTPPPRSGAGTTTLNADTARWANYVRRLAVVRGYEVLDAHALMADPVTGEIAAPYNEGDGVHPNNAGYLVIARAFADILRRVFPRKLNPWATSPFDPALSTPVGLFASDLNADGRAESVAALSGATGSIISGAPAGKWQRKSIAAGSTSPGQLYYDITGLTAGHVYEVALLIEADLEAATEAVKANIEIQARSSTAAFGWVSKPWGLVLLKPTDRLYYHAERALPEGADRIRLIWAFTGTAVGAGYVQVAQYTVRDLTALGIV